MKIVHESSSNCQELRQLYFASPLDLTPRTWVYRAALAAALKRWPTHTIFEPLCQLWTNEQWLAEWPKLLPTISILALVLREDGSIGVGCWQEAADARRAGIPVFVHDFRAKVFRPLVRLRLAPLKSRTFPNYAIAFPHPPAPRELLSHRSTQHGSRWVTNPDGLSQSWIPAGETVCEGPPIGGWDHGGA